MKNELRNVDTVIKVLRFEQHICQQGRNCYTLRYAREELIPRVEVY